MKRIIRLLSFAVILASGCKEKKAENAFTVKKVDTLANMSSLIQPQHPLKVSAYLVYEDGSLSDFDVLNDNSIVLWNTIIGAGDAAKPSGNTRLIISGSIDSLQIRIKNGSIATIDTVILKPADKFDYLIKNTGCDVVHINMARNKKEIYNDTIPFHCGE